MVKKGVEKMSITSRIGNLLLIALLAGWATDAAFAIPGLYDLLESEGYEYAIRLTEPDG